MHPEGKCSSVVQVNFGRKGRRAFCRWAAFHINCGSLVLTDQNKTEQNKHKYVIKSLHKGKDRYCWTVVSERTQTHKNLHTPTLTIRSIHWLICENLSSSFHFPLFPFPPPSGKQTNREEKHHGYRLNSLIDWMFNVATS